MTIFLSWSGRTGHAVAQALADWIPSVIQASETYVSEEDLRSGSGWAKGVSKELGRSSLGIVCVVPGTVDAPWLNFEAGVLWKSLELSKVIPLLVDVEGSQLDRGPLAQFPRAVFDKEDMYRIVETINERAETMKLSEERLRNSFEIWWPKLEQDVGSILGKRVEAARRDEAPEKAAGRPESADPAGGAVEPAGKPEADEYRDSGRPAISAAARPALDHVDVEMLKVLRSSPGDAPMTAAAVGYRMDVSAQIVRERLDTLERKNYVLEHLFGGRPKEYSIGPKGKEYLARNAPSGKPRDR
ncbi:MAG TPA: TIR domain-containing protein [Candidatus Aquicultoraceae bacterium]|nr:TIR domain-containing protein [Candidatus Aquicultoraceae bacterium]